MIFRTDELRDKEVINTSDGSKLGYAYDVEVDTVGARLVSLVLPGRLRLFGLLGREEDIVIPWSNILLIGDETILTDYKCENRIRKRSFLDSLVRWR